MIEENIKVQETVDKWSEMIGLQLQTTEINRKINAIRGELRIHHSGYQIYNPLTIKECLDKNHDFNDSEREYVFGKILTDNLEPAKYFFDYCCSNNFSRYKNYSKYVRECAFNTLLLHPETVWEFISRTYERILWTENEIDMIYKTHGELYKQKFGSGINDLFFYVRMFKKRIDRNIVDLFINRIVNRKHTAFAIELINNKEFYPLTDYDTEKLESVIIYKKLLAK